MIDKKKLLESALAKIRQIVPQKQATQLQKFVESPTSRIPTPKMQYNSSDSTLKSLGKAGANLVTGAISGVASEPFKIGSDLGRLLGSQINKAYDFQPASYSMRLGQNLPTYFGENKVNPLATVGNYGPGKIKIGGVSLPEFGISESPIGQTAKMAMGATEPIFTATGLKAPKTVGALMGASGVLGGGFSALTGGDFKQGALETMINTAPTAVTSAGFLKGTNKLVEPNIANTVLRIPTKSTLNVMQGIGLDNLTGNETTGLSLALDAIMPIGLEVSGATFKSLGEAKRALEAKVTKALGKQVRNSKGAYTTADKFVKGTRPYFKSGKHAQGALLGFEIYQDEQGNYQVRFDKNKALIGMALTTGITKASDITGNALKDINLPKDLEPLAQEAKKYASADDFFNAVNGMADTKLQSLGFRTSKFGVTHPQNPDLFKLWEDVSQATGKSPVAEVPQKVSVDSQINKVRESLYLGDSVEAKSIYDNIAGDKPDFDELEGEILKYQEGQIGEALNEAMVGKYGDYVGQVKKIVAKLKRSGESKNATGMLNREHISAEQLRGKEGTDELASNLGMTETEFMREMQEAAGITGGGEQARNILSSPKTALGKSAKQWAEKTMQERLKLDKDYYKVSDNGSVSVSYDPQSTATIKKIIQAENLEQANLEARFRKHATKPISIEDVTNLIGKNTTASQWDISDMRDIGNTAKGFKDVYRNFETVFGKQFPKIKRTILDPFDSAKGKFVDMQKTYLDDLETNVVKNLGIKKGSKLSELTQKYGEGILSDAEKAKIKPEDMKKIVEADKYFRSKYDDLLNKTNKSIEKIYPNQPEKLIPRRSDYYRHFTEMQEGLGAIKNIFDSPSNIPADLSGLSEFTTPRQKFLSIAQQRIGNKTTYDAVGGYLNYLRQSAYATHIDPEISKFRNLASDLESLTSEGADVVNVGKVNNFLWFLREYANGLSGKTNPLDRQIQELIPGGRTTFRAATWLNNRVKANVILGNISSAFAQPFNIPQAAADMGFGQFAKGAGKSLAGVIDGNSAIKESSFINERYFKDYAKFDTGMLNNVKKMAVWITGVLDEVSTKSIWNGYHDKALAEGIPNPVKYADDLTRKMVAGRGVGEVPIAQESKVFQLVAPFQLEVSNLWNVFGDWAGNKDAVSKMVKFSVASYLMNRMVENIRGSDVSFDPINAALEAHEAFGEEEDTKIGLARALGRIGGEFLSNVPMGQTIAGAYPEYGFKVGETQAPTRSDLFGEGDPTRFGSGLLAIKGLQDPLFKIAPPFGGQQIQRTLKGIKVQQQGYSESKTGRVRFPVEQNAENAVRNVLFGEYSTPEAREYFDKDRTTLGEKQSELFKQASDKIGVYTSIMNKREKDNAKDKAKEALKESGGAKVVGEEILIMSESGDINTIKIVEPPTSPTERIRWESQAYKDAKKVLSAQDLTPEDKDLIIQSIGLNPNDVQYYDLASETNRIKLVAVKEQISSITNREAMLQDLVDMRREVAGEMVLTSGVIDSLVDEEIISKEEAKTLKAVTVDNKGTAKVKITGRGKGAKLKAVKFVPLDIPTDSPSLPSASGLQLDTPQGFNIPTQAPAVPSLRVSTPESPKYQVKFNL